MGRSVDEPSAETVGDGMAEFLETVIDHVGGINCSDDWCGVSTGEKRIITKLKRLQEKYPKEVECISENKGGSVYYHVPWSYIHIYKPRVLSEAEKELRREIIRDATAFRMSSADNANEPNLRENSEVE